MHNCVSSRVAKLSLANARKKCWETRVHFSFSSSHHLPFPTLNHQTSKPNKRQSISSENEEGERNGRKTETSHKKRAWRNLHPPRNHCAIPKSNCITKPPSIFRHAATFGLAKSHALFPPFFCHSLSLL